MTAYEFNSIFIFIVIVGVRHYVSPSLKCVYRLWYIYYYSSVHNCRVLLPGLFLLCCCDCSQHLFANLLLSFIFISQWKIQILAARVKQKNKIKYLFMRKTFCFQSRWKCFGHAITKTYAYFKITCYIFLVTILQLLKLLYFSNVRNQFSPIK